MKSTRRTAVLSFVFLAAASAASASEAYRPLPYPPFPCDKYDLDCPKPKPPRNPCFRLPCEPGPIVPLDSVSGKAAEITAAIGDGKLTTASEALDGLFSGSGAKSGGKSSEAGSAVYAGDFLAAPRLPPSAGVKARAEPRGEVPAPRSPFWRVQCGTKEGCQSETGKFVEDATKPIWDAVDKIGDKLRDRNDDKLREGTQRQKDAEREHKEKKERERPTV